MRVTRNCIPVLSLFILGLTSASQAWAEASDKLWPSLQESFFAGKTLEPATFIKLEGPRRAESGAQVPVTLTIDKAPNDKDAIKKVYVIVDANPIPLTAIYHFTEMTGSPQLSTRIRMETDSYIHAVGETADGRLFVTDTVIRAAGGCGGTVDGDDTAVRATAGKIKLNVDPAAQPGAPAAIAFHIKHPMFTGLQRELVSGGYKPAFYIQKVAFTYNGKPVMNADFAVGVAEDPYLRFNYLPGGPGTLEVKAEDNEGGMFSQTLDVKN
ncbi:MAG: quinoprotein dehydrogenase-associated SoxYZ-like carrier [Methylobacillus sp.]|jgi:sulfur-oxidizing protein SoxY|nr:quinoprotein dehydrogenase-associated SoxYZ-like carrier [Methylobacillus sp.]